MHFAVLVSSVCGYPAPTYAVHILNNRHEYGTTENTLQLIKPLGKAAK